MIIPRSGAPRGSRPVRISRTADTLPYSNGVPGGTFVDCVFESCISWGDGGAVSGVDATPTFIGCVFDGNTANYDGGAARFGDGVSAVFDACTFNGNYSGSGGSAIACVSDMFRTAAVCTVRNSIIAFGFGSPSTCVRLHRENVSSCDPGDHVVRRHPGDRHRPAMTADRSRQ